ncbi:hypothetical protein DL95DRAFT_524689 [Leptodontidium sp. 2 PMI_412]|nr:hypothetical protein DL95DRAFT_524689 [Leptodontidium sp. 2 PMI_412]
MSTTATSKSLLASSKTEVPSPKKQQLTTCERYHAKPPPPPSALPRTPLSLSSSSPSSSSSKTTTTATNPNLSLSSPSQAIAPATTTPATATTIPSPTRGLPRREIKQQPIKQTQGQEQGRGLKQKQTQLCTSNTVLISSARNQNLLHANPPTKPLRQQPQPQPQLQTTTFPTSPTRPSPLQATSDLKVPQSRLKSILKQRQRFILKLCGSDSGWINSSLTVDERSLFKLDITFVKASQDSSLSRPPPKVSPGTTASEYDDPGLDGGLDGPPPNNCTSTPDDSSTDLPFPLSLDSRFSRVSYVSDKIADSLGPPCGFRDLDFAYPSWASSGVISAKHNKDYLVMITCHTGEPGADEVLRSELESCIVTANRIKDKRSGKEDSTIEGRVISVTLQSLRILSFRLEPIWLSLTKEEPRLQIFVEACDINASLAWENQDDHIVSPEYLKTFLEKK